MMMMIITTTTTIMGLMLRPARGAPAFTEHRHSRSPDLCTLINPYRYQLWLHPSAKV